MPSTRVPPVVIKSTPWDLDLNSKVCNPNNPQESCDYDAFERCVLINGRAPRCSCLPGYARSKDQLRCTGVLINYSVSRLQESLANLPEAVKLKKAKVNNDKQGLATSSQLFSLAGISATPWQFSLIFIQ